MLVEPFILKLKVLELFQSITFSSQSLTRLGSSLPKRFNLFSSYSE